MADIAKLDEEFAMGNRLKSKVTLYPDKHPINLTSSPKNLFG